MHTGFFPLRSRGWLRPARTLRLLLFLLALGVPGPTALRAQIRIPDAALLSETAIQQVLDRGRELESQQRWGEALMHYETAVKDYPGRRELQDRLSFARVNFDIGRRYQDDSYRAALRELTERRALDLYTEVLRRIELNYVQAPNWQELAQSGLSNLCVALGRPTFQHENGVTLADARTQAFCQDMRRRMQVTVVRNRDEAVQVATTVARQGQQQLELRPQAAILEFTCGAVCRWTNTLAS